MLAIGWQKSQDFMQIIGRYIKKFTPGKRERFNAHFLQSPCVSHIIGSYFQEMANVPFSANQSIMQALEIPSFDSLCYGDKPSETFCSPHLTFTTDGFFNHPHIDKKDISPFAFVLFLPTYSSDGRLAPPESGYDITGGKFCFADYATGINFDYQHGVVKIIWQANKYKHCTLPHSPSSTFTHLGMSLQINFSLANAWCKYQLGHYDDPLHYFGDHLHYMFCCIANGSLITVLFFFQSFFLFFFLQYASNLDSESNP